MNKGINYATAELKEILIQKINESQLPAVNAEMVLESILLQVREIKIQEIQKEREAYMNSRKERSEVKEENLNE